MLWLLLYTVVSALLLLVVLLLFKSYFNDTLGSLYLHGSVGILLGAVLLVAPLPGLALALLLFGYQYLQTITNQGAQSNDENLAGYILGAFIVILLVKAQQYLFAAPNRTIRK